MDNDRTEFAAWLDSLIGDNKRYPSNRRLAEVVGVSPDTIRRMLSGEIPSLRTLQKIADAISGVSLADLQRMAGILPELPSEKEKRYLRRLESVASRLPQGDQDLLLNIALDMLERSENQPED